MKDEVLRILKRNEGVFVSSEIIADELSMSRTDVDNEVCRLIDDGFSITIYENQSYKLETSVDSLDREDIIKRLRSPFAVRVYDEVDSTNTVAKELIGSYGEQTNIIVAANSQTAGRGRRGRNFYSPPSTGIYLSVVLHPNIFAEQSVLVLTAAAVAACKAIERVCHKSPSIKWLNDIFYDGKKVAGILTEGVVDMITGKMSAVVVGIGINVSTTDFPSELSSTAGSLGKAPRCELIAEFANELFKYCETFLLKRHLDEYRGYCFVLGREVTVIKGEEKFIAKVINIDDMGRLIVEKDKKILLLTNEEVSIRIGANK